MTFFSVDVETTSTNPFKGHLLTVGIVTVHFNETWVKGPTFYERLEFPDKLDPMENNSLEWWVLQDDEVRGEAFTAYPRNDNEVAALNIANFVRSVEPDYEQSIFVANPVAFDKPWIDKLFADVINSSNPFHYRSLCLRSMKYGMVADPTFGSDRTTHESKLPHHALWDADAQAEDLIEMLSSK
jgi:DNA polymerase III epsilon subunit-like protein